MFLEYLLWYVKYRSYTVTSIFLAGLGLGMREGWILGCACFLSALAPWLDSDGPVEPDDNPEEL